MCMATKHCNFSSNVTTWTVHGLWPDEGCEKGPNYCNRTSHLRPVALEPIFGKLMEFWPDMFNGSVYGLWEHEWLKHGTCAIQLPHINSQLDYFSDGLQLNEKYNMTRMFEKSSIFPENDKQFDIEQFYHVLDETLGADSYQLICHRHDDKQYIQQVEMCLDIGLNIMKCPSCPANVYFDTQILNSGNCKRDEAVYYEKIIYPKHH
ncbi:hypothetical protein SNEBB_011049 [Seison nebaliae]|nr:hypothetical protein SNEBB_011049 [Seison nebaliae]